MRRQPKASLVLKQRSCEKTILVVYVKNLLRLLTERVKDEYFMSEEHHFQVR